MARDGFVIKWSIYLNEGVLQSFGQAGRLQISDVKWGQHCGRRKLLVLVSAVCARIGGFEAEVDSLEMSTDEVWIRVTFITGSVGVKAVVAAWEP